MNHPLYRHRHQIAFADTDASGWMHFPNAFRYFELAEHAFLRQVGLLVFDRSQGGWPRVSATCEYNHPLLAGDPIEILVAVTKIGSSSVTWAFEIHRLRDHQIAAHGSITTVRVDANGKPIAISDEERTKLGSSRESNTRLPEHFPS